jgi:hypothetical protein
MGTYLKKFDTESEYNGYIESEDFILPNVSLVVDGYDVKFIDMVQFIEELPNLN